ncbi:MAG TPA: hypothetical protein VM283_02245, partial [Armatimonadota bacterium]|nr:hypothetical protein [Armatimonadota bacterium]
PKGFTTDGDTITAEVFPELPADQYADKTDPKLLTMNYYWYRDGAYLIPAGTEPTADVLLYFRPKPAGDQPEDRLAADAWQAPVLLAATPEEYCASGAFMALEASKPGRFEAFDTFARKGLDALERGRQQRQEYSWINYGDTYGERYVNWTNQEYDPQWGLLVCFARTGDMAYFDSGLQAASHTAAIDMINWASDPNVLGIQKEHALWHTGGYGTPRPPDTPYWFDKGIWNTGHVWTQGTYAAYCLTGERRYYESIERLTEFLARSSTSQMERWVHRNYGWLPIATLGGYHVTGNPYYLDAARFFTQNVVDRQDPGSGALIHPIGECEHTPRHMGGKSFMTGVVMTGLTMMDQIEPSDGLKRALTLSADWLYARMWNDERSGFRYAQCPQFDASGGDPVMECEGLAYAWDVSHQPQYREMLERSLGRMIYEGSPSSSGKGYATQIRMTPFAVSAMDRWGLDDVPPPAPRQPALSMPAQLYMVPGQPASLGINVGYSSAVPLAATAEITRLPEGLKADPARAQWQIERGTTRGPEFTITGQAAAGEPITVHWTAGQWQGDLTATVHLRQPIELGQGIGYVGDADDTVGQALGTLGINLPALPDLKAETLAGYRALLVGREAHEKNFLGIRESNQNLLDFIYSGGTVVFIQLQDSSWQRSWLPAPLTLSNDAGSLGEIVARDHPIFTTPNRLQSLAGVISYDTITEAGEGWTVLATDDKGRPSIVEMAAGEGRVLVVQPSPDRYVVGAETPAGGLTTDACAAFIENLVAYLQSHTTGH